MPIKTFQAEIECEVEAHLGEGPVWDGRRQILVWVDILSGTLFEYNPATGENKSYDIGEHIGAAALRAKGGFVLALKSGFAFFDPETRTIERITDPESDLPGNRFNDGKCDPSGRFWAGTLNYDIKKGYGSLYCLNRDLSVEKKLSGVTISNGLAWDTEKNLFYFIDTPIRQISVFDYEPETGHIRNRRVVKQLAEKDGYPDGMAIDEEGCLWVALYGGGRVIRINPKNGQITAEVRLPVPKPTSCAFGGKNLDDLYITTCREHMSQSEIREAPLSGSLFKVKLPVKGLPAYLFAG